MATILKQNQQDQENQDQAISTSAQSSQIAPQAGAPSGAPAGGGQVPQQPSSSGRFTNIQSFIRANRPGQLGQMVEQKAGQEKEQSVGQLQKTKTAAESQLGQVGQSVQASRDEVGKGIEALSGNNFAPTAEAADQAISQLSGALNMQYQGPEGLGNEARLAGEVQNLQQLGQASRTEGGRYALLQRFFGRDRPTYTQGQTSLDNLLLGRENQALSGLRRTGREFAKDLQTAQQDIAGQVQQQKSNVQGLREEAKSKATPLLSQAEAAAREDLQRTLQEYESNLGSYLNQQGQLINAPVLIPRVVDRRVSDPSRGIESSMIREAIETPITYTGSLTQQELQNLGIMSDNPFIQAARRGDVSALAGVNEQRASTFSRLANLLGESSALTATPLEKRTDVPELNRAALAGVNEQISSNLQQEILNSPEIIPGKPGSDLIAQYASGELDAIINKYANSTRADERRYAETYMDLKNKAKQAYDSAVQRALNKAIGREIQTQPTYTNFGQ